ncbi:TetR/AcrR family transcriptional regulator [Paenibacillus sp. BK720]|uniref:TetR/AcrR family transcriptional regulator n=1 Tax=Paenibacillus sp. BK720 TaxID=2587092 RepID=UPI001FBA3450|nr:TetR/AcrR family transcriptional regulator [Paenibacillus sp. BK720]NIK70416.1 AcrR family transcriptional regulator [Paenibacillus sp. BK720]
MWSQKPIEKISVQEIAIKSGCNRSTFYQYFTDIYELLDSVENDLLNDIKKELANNELSMHTVQDTLCCLDKREHLLVLNALLGDYGSARFVKRLKKEITLDQLELNVPQNHSLTPYFIEFYLATALSLFRLWLQRQKDLSSEEFLKLVENLYSRGITPYFKE